MSVFRRVAETVDAAVQALADAGHLPQGLDITRITVEPARDPSHGDVATNAALVLSRDARRPPKQIAQLLAEHLGAQSFVAGAEVAGPGFVNLRLRDSFWRAELVSILESGLAYGDSSIGCGVPVNVEYVSANPTGPLHVGHGRGAVVGDALASLLAKAGFAVTREYYTNDAGGQIDALARSLFRRYLVALGRLSTAEFEAELNAGAITYGGDYLQAVANEVVERDGDRWADAEETEWLPALSDLAVGRMMERIRDDLDNVGIRFDVVVSERALVRSGAVQSAFDALAERDLIYTGVLDAPRGKLPDDWEQRPQVLFRATRFGDDVDRPLQKSDGTWTYFATDIAYHLDKYRRGFSQMIDVWGADHGGYVKRMQAAVNAVSEGRAQVDVKLCQLVNLLEGGEPVKMSKRAGTFVTLREVIDRVGRGVFRFIVLTRRNDAPLDFDFAKVTEQSRENPVFYVQYAHARCCSVLRLAATEPDAIGPDDPRFAKADLDRLTDRAEMDLIKALAGWPRVIESAALAHEPHRLAFYLQEIAALFHLLWTRGKDDARLRFIHSDDPALTAARMALVRATQLVVASGLSVIGVEPVEELR